MGPRERRNEALGKRVVKALESRNMEAYYAASKEDAVKTALGLIAEGSTVTMGGSASIRESGLIEALKEGPYTFYDRDLAPTPEERDQIAREASNCDWYLGSVNAMSEDGVFVNIDGNANRVAAYAFGPKNVLLLVGMNKLVKTEDDAMHRARNEAAPINTQRFGSDTPCVRNGSCFDCKSEDCICCQIMITRFSRIPKRFKVILVGENLGF